MPKTRRKTISLTVSPRTDKQMRTIAEWLGTSYSEAVARALDRFVQLLGLPEPINDPKENGAMKPALVYARVSTHGQAEDGTSLQTQVEACQRWATQNGYTVVKAITDDVSGSTLKRAGLDEVRDIVSRKEVQAVIIYKLDRLSRETSHTLTLFAEFKRHGVDLKSATSPIEDTPEGKLLLTMLSAIAEFERTQIGERTRRGKHHRAKEGAVLGSGWAPMGIGT